MNKDYNFCKICSIFEHKNPNWDDWEECCNCINDYTRFSPSIKLKQHFLAHGLILNKQEKTTIIVMGFPGVGKTYAKETFKGSNIKVLDSDSSTFNKNNFPDNYFEYLTKVYKDFDIIFISTHKDVREAIKKTSLVDNCYTCVCYPDKSLKKDWIERLQNRGNNEKFCKLIEDNYDNWIDDIEKDDTFFKMKLNCPNENLLSELKWKISWYCINSEVNSYFRK